MNVYSQLREVTATVIPATRYIFFRYMGPERHLVGNQGTKFTLKKGLYFGVNIIPNSKFIRAIIGVLGPEKLFDIKPALAYQIMRQSIARPLPKAKKKK